MQKRPSSHRQRRAPVPADSIVTDLRARIVSGELKPGDRLPTRSECEARYAAASMTIQRAFTRLAQDGFITAKGRHGTFVAEKPPHLHRFILSIPVHNGGDMLKFWIRLRDAADGIMSSGRAHIETYYGIAPGIQGGDLPRLEADLKTGCIAGIIFANNPWQMKNHTALTKPGLPRIGFLSGGNGMDVLRMGMGGAGSDFFDIALRHLIAQGRKRIAMMAVPGQGDTGFRNAMAKHGLPFHEHWVQFAPQPFANIMVNQVQLLMHPPLGERPDAIVIADDHLVDAVCNGLMRLGLAPGPDLDVVAHANFPLDSPAALPIARLGFDIPEALLAAIDVLERKRRGEIVPEVTIVKPRFEELSAVDGLA